MTTIQAIKALKEGSMDGLAVLYEEYCNKVYKIALGVLGNEFDAEDLMQEIFLALPEKIDKLEDDAAFEKWLSVMTRNRATDVLRKKKPLNFSEMGSEEDDFDFEDSLENDNRDFMPVENYDYEETKRLIGGLVDDLPEKQRLCVTLRFRDGLTIAEIAAKTGLPEATVKSCLRYGKKKLEEGVTDLEKKGYKLYGVTAVALLPFLRWALGGTKDERVGRFSAARVAARVGGLRHAVEAAENAPISIATESPRTAGDVPQTVAQAPTPSAPYAASRFGTVVNRSAGVASAAPAATASASVATEAVSAVANAATGGKKRFWIKLVTIVSALLIAVGTPVAIVVGTKSTPEKTIRQFETAVQKADFKGIVACCEPTLQQEYKAELGLLGLLGGEDLAYGLLGMIVGSSDDIDLENYQLDILSVQYIGDDRAIVTVHEQGTSKPEEIHMKKINGTWYMAKNE